MRSTRPLSAAWDQFALGAGFEKREKGKKKKKEEERGLSLK